MKKIYSLALCIFAFVGVFAQPGNVPELIYYQFDGTGSTVPNKASTPVGTNPAPITSMTQGGTGQFGGALVSGGSGAVNTGWNTSLTGNWTMSFWINFGSTATSFQYFLGDAGASSFRCFANGAAGAGNIILRGPVSDVIVTGVADGNPHVVHFVYNGTNIQAYKDGVLNNTVAQSFSSIGPGTGFNVGAYGTSVMASGALMDEFRLYNRALTLPEITSTWNKILPLYKSKDDAGVASIDTPSVFCAGPQNIWVTVQNFGINQIDSVTVNWMYNGALQTPVMLNQMLDTAQGTGPDKRQIMLGTKTITTVDTIVAWTSMPNSVVDTLTQNDTSVYIGGPSLSGTFTIGGVGANYPTFTAAVNDLISYGVCGPVLFNVNKGTYNEQITLPSINGASSVNTITFDGMNKDSVSLQFASTSTLNNWVIMHDGGEYFTFQNMEIRNTGTSTYKTCLNWSNTSGNNNYLNLRIMSDTSYYATSWYSSLIIHQNYTSNNIVFDGCDFLGGSYAFYWYGSSSTPYTSSLTVDNSWFAWNDYRPINFYYLDAPKFRWNTIDATRSQYTSTFYTMYIYYCDNDMEIIGNNINGGNHFGYGMRMYYCDGTAAKQSWIANNMIIMGDSTNASYADGIYCYYSGYQNFYNNSILTANSGSTSYGLYVSQGGGNNVINNNVYTYGNGYGFYLAAAYNVVNVENNNWYAPNSTNLAYVGGTPYTSMSAYQSATGYDQNGLNVDPLFYSFQDLHTCNDTLRGAGQSNPNITVDIDMEARAAMPAIGADEFMTLSGAFLGPDTSFCPGDSVEIGVNMNGTFAWSTGDTTSTIWVKTGGTYFLTATSACGNGSDNIVVTAKPVPTAGFTWSQSFFTSLFTSTSTNASSYWWDFGDGNQSTQQNPTHVYAYPGGTFTVTHVAYNECGNDTVKQTVQADETTGIDHNQFNSTVSIFPNPNNGEFVVSMALDQNQTATIEMINVAGKLVHNQQLTGKQGLNRININGDFAKGVYFVRIKTENNTAIKKLIIE